MHWRPGGVIHRHEKCGKRVVPTLPIRRARVAPHAGLQGFIDGEDQWIQPDGDDCTGQKQGLPFSRQQVKGHADSGQNEGKFANLGEAPSDR